MFGFNFKRGFPSNEKPGNAFDAAINGDSATMQNLLSAGIAVNAKGEDGYTPLMAAASLGREDIVRLLLNADADINAINNEGRTALKVASDNKHDVIVNLLSEAGTKKKERMMSS